MTHENTYRHDTCMMVYYILFIQEIKDIILNSMESSRFRDSRNRSSCKLEKTRTDPAGFKLKEPTSGIFFCFRKSDEATTSSASMVVKLVTALYGHFKIFNLYPFQLLLTSACWREYRIWVMFSNYLMYIVSTIS